VIRMMMSEYQPLDRLRGDRTDGLNQLIGLGGTREGIDHHHTGVGYHESGVGAALGASAGVTEDSVHTRSQPANR
jgi:hypothetical protein